MAGKKMADKKVETGRVVSIKPFRTLFVVIKVRGISPLIVNRWHGKINVMPPAPTGETPTPTQPRPPRNPEKSFRESLYVYAWDKRSNKAKTYGIPAIWAKRALVSMGKEFRLGSTIQTAVRVGHTGDFNELVPIKHGKGDPHQQIGPDGTPGVRVMVGTGMKRTVDIRFRGEFSEWEADFLICYRPDRVSLDTLTTLLNEAGQWNGFGENRPQKGGTNGMFEVVLISKPQERIR
jgi:hypothetical protein